MNKIFPIRRIKSVRKAPQCWHCAESIEVGCPAVVSACLDGKAVSSFYYHPECWVGLDKYIYLLDYVGDGDFLSQGEFRRGSCYTKDEEDSLPADWRANLDAWIDENIRENSKHSSCA